MPNSAPEIMGWGFLQADEETKSEHGSASPHCANGSGPRHFEADRVVQNLATSTLLMELARRANGLGHKKWKIEISPRRLQAWPYGVLWNLMKGSSRLLPPAEPATPAAQQQKTKEESKSKPSRAPVVLDLTGSEEMPDTDFSALSV